MLVLYSLFMGLSIGPFALLALTGACDQHGRLCKWASVTGFLAIVIAGISAFSHLLKPLKAIYIFANFNSPMTQETVAVLITALIAALLAAALLFNWLPGSASRLLAWFGLLMAILSVILISAIYLIPVRPAWNTWLLPVTLLLSSLANGLLLAWALASLIPAEAGESGRPELVEKLRTWSMPALVVYAIFAVVFFLQAAGQAGGQGRLLNGDLALYFWLGLVAFGILAPAAVLWLGRKYAGASALVAFVFVAAGGLIARAMLFPLGTHIPIQSLW